MPRKTVPFISLTLPQQAALVLIGLMDDLANNKKTVAEIEHHVSGLYAIVDTAFPVDDAELNLIIEAVARQGIEMLPAYPKEVINGKSNSDDQADGIK